MDLVEFYLKSSLDLCALWPGTKKPIWTKKFAARLTFDQKLDSFYHDPALGVAVWLDPRFEVFDHDSGRLPLPGDTLVATRGDHAHVWFEASGEIYNTARRIADDLDTRSAGGLLVLPPTRHKDGGFYEWHSLRIPKPVPPEYMALWLNRKIEGARAGVRLYELPERIEYGTRDNTLWSYGRGLKAAGADSEFITRRLRQVNLERCAPPLSPDEIERKIRHVLTWRDDPEKFQAKAKGVAA
jgi:putative DNA primase/helicase